MSWSWRKVQVSTLDALALAFNGAMSSLSQALANAEEFTLAKDGDTTPSVGGGISKLLVSHSGATALTALDEGKIGQAVDVHFGTANTTVDFTGTTLKGNGGSDWTPGTGDSMRCVKGQDLVWRCAVAEG